MPFSSSRTGILIAQLGTPDAPTTSALRRYLRQFLGDRRVVEQNPLVWWFVLNFLILPRRPARSAALYRRVWTDQGSPLLLHSLAQAQGLSRRLGARVQVEVGMRYGNPSIASALERMQDCDRVLIFPMFPQYTSATTGSVHDAVFEHYGRTRVIPALRTVPPYYQHPAYVDALAAIASQELAKLSWKPQRLLLSYHGIPQRFVDNGDVYAQHCEATTAALRRALSESLQQSYQSRFGSEEWLKPYTDETLARLPGEGVTHLAVMCPGFTADCLETIDEIGREGRHTFMESGGKEFALLPCLSDSTVWLDAMARIAREELAGWME